MTTVSLDLDLTDALAVGTSLRMLVKAGRIPDPLTAAAYERIGTRLVAAAKAGIAADVAGTAERGTGGRL